MHVAIIMDGNGRWAQERGLPRTAGHRAGVETVRRVVESAPGLGVGTLTLFTFSSDNWRRPPSEVRPLLRLLADYLASEVGRCVEHGVRVSVLGRRDRLPLDVLRKIEAMEAATRSGAQLHLRLAVDYSARDAMVRAARQLNDHLGSSQPCFARLVNEAMNGNGPAPDVDLLIRTGGEQRLSDFLLWESAYAELWFTPIAWPDFSSEHLGAAIEDFGRRERRFGGVDQQASPPGA
jgi:undecaprenyl diphosphate synthase